MHGCCCSPPAAVLLHGCHPYVEDAEIYVPGIKKALDVALYPHNAEFFASHARLTLFPNRLKQDFGVKWVVRESGVAGLVGPYQNARLLVCQLE